MVPRIRWSEAISVLSADPGFAELELTSLTQSARDEVSRVGAAFERSSSGHRCCARQDLRASRRGIWSFYEVDRKGLDPLDAAAALCSPAR